MNTAHRTALTRTQQGLFPNGAAKCHPERKIRKSRCHNAEILSLVFKGLGNPLSFLSLSKEIKMKVPAKLINKEIPQDRGPMWRRPLASEASAKEGPACGYERRLAACPQILRCSGKLPEGIGR